MRPIYCLVGASGTGKSTILNYAKDNLPLRVEEVSARPFLPKDMDYVNSLDEQSQVLITQHRFVSLLEGIFDNTLPPILYSRSPIDSLAYEHALRKAPFLIELLERQIEVSKAHIHYLYLPIEFNMGETEDIIRGTNDKVQKDTDLAIKFILTHSDVNYTMLSGTPEERIEKLKEVLREGSVYA